MVENCETRLIFLYTRAHYPIVNSPLGGGQHSVPVPTFRCHKTGWGWVGGFLPIKLQYFVFLPIKLQYLYSIALLIVEGAQTVGSPVDSRWGIPVVRSVCTEKCTSEQKQTKKSARPNQLAQLPVRTG
jgi:hypothetical protein